MKRFFLLALVFASQCASPAVAQIVSSPAQQVQGTPAVNRGYPVKVQITDGSGNAITSEVPTGPAGTPATDVITVQGIAGGTAQPISAASLPLPTGASTSAAQTTAATSNGAPGDAACTTDTASCGANAQRQRIAQRLTTINTTLGTPFQAGGSIGNTTFAATQSGTWNITNVSGTVSLPTGAATSANQTAAGASAQTVQGSTAAGATDAGSPVEIGGFASSTIPSAVSTGQRVRAWFGLNGQVVSSAYPATLTGADAQSNTVNGVSDYQGNLVRQLVHEELFNGTTWDRIRGDADGLVVQAGLSSTSWTYANGATGILSNTTTAVTIKAAAGASVRNFIDSCQINTTTFTTAGPIAIRDGAGGTIIWALQVPTAGFLSPVTVVFATPLRGTANTLMEVVTTTANTVGTAWVNCQGHTGS